MNKQSQRTQINKGMLEYDVCIFGAGMVGAAAACGLAKQGLTVALIEPYQPEPFEDTQAPDLRVSALNYHSINLLDELGALSHIKNTRYRYYDSLEVWENDAAKAAFNAADIKEKYLGMFVENRLVQLALHKTLEETAPELVHIIDDSAEHINVENATVELDSGNKIQAKCLIGAEGAQSPTRQKAGIGQTAWQYAQRANIICIRLHEHIPDQTWQQFTPDGPLALLPMYGDYASLVWYCDDEQSHRIQNTLSDEQLKQAIVQRFPDRLSDFDIVDKGGFGLTRMHANQYFQDKAVLLGDAAHTINPLAGQGVNLGFKDVSVFLEAIKSSGMNELPTALAAYERARRPQNLLMMTTMDALYLGFSNNIAPVKVMRNAALFLAQRAGPIKQMALKYAMGL